MQENLELVRETERHRITGISRTQWWRMERAGLAPRRVAISENTRGWLRHELNEWIRERMALREAGAGRAVS